jgi:hypothetical protein
MSNMFDRDGAVSQVSTEGAVMTDRATLTALYLEEVGRRGVRASELLSVMPKAGPMPAKYRQDYLSRPLFLGHAERDQLNQDLQQLRTALVSLPGLLYGGDLAAFARAVGMTGDQAAAVLRSRTGQITQLARADMYPARDGLHVLEFNMGSGIEGIDNDDICRWMLRHPVLREFARAHRLGYVDTMHTQVSMVLQETGFQPGSFPMVAITDWPAHYQRIGTYLHKLARRWRSLGLDAHACHLGELKAGGGRIRLRGRPVDIVFRLFLIEHLLEPEGHALMDPVIDAAARGEVAVFTPLDSELFGSKAPLAMLSDDANRKLLPAAQLAAIDRVLPWTRMVRPGPVTLEDGRTVDLLGYAASHAGDLVLKPTLLHGGLGVLPGWHPGVSAQVWRDRLAGAAGGPYVLQRRIRPEPELCPGEDGEPVAWVTTWGVFTRPEGYGGVFARAFTAASQVAVLRTGMGCYVGCCLDAPPGPGAGA